MILFPNISVDYVNQSREVSVDLLQDRRLNYTEAIEFGNRYRQQRSDAGLAKNQDKQVEGGRVIQDP